MPRYSNRYVGLALSTFVLGCGSSSGGAGDAGRRDSGADVQSHADAAPESAPPEASAGTDACVPAGGPCSAFNCCNGAGCWDPDGTEIVCM